MRFQFVIFIAYFVFYINAREGYYKDLFMDGGVGLNSRMTLPAADDLGLEYEYIADEDTLTNQINMISNIEDDNGFLLYPDGCPRFKMIFVNGGDADIHGTVMGEEGRSRIREFVHKGGSYVGTCAGAILATIHTNTWLDPDTNYFYYNLWPARAHFTQLANSYVDLKIPSNSPLLDYNYLNGDTLIENVLHNGGVFAIKDDSYYWVQNTEELSVYDNSDIQGNDTDYIEFFNYGSIWAFKESGNSGRLVLSGSHPEGVDYGDQLALMKSMLQYAMDGAGTPTIKVNLKIGDTREMNNNSSEGYEKIGDKQYHHFRINVGKNTDGLLITLNGDSGFDFNLYVNSDTFAFKSSALYQDTGTGNIKSLTVPVSEGEWYIGVECVSTITSKKHSWGYTYEGAMELMNGVPYTIMVDEGLVDLNHIPEKDEEIKVTINSSNSIMILNPFLNKMQIQIIDLRGRVIWEQKNVYKDRITIDPNIKPGLYLLRIKTRNEIITKKLIIHQ